MNKSELAIKLLQWEEQKRKLDELTEQISAGVLERGETVTVGNVRATYSKGRNEYDYEKAVRNNSDDPIVKALIEKYTKTIAGHWVPEQTVTNWREVAGEHDIEPVIVKPGTPSVKIKLLEETG